MISLFYRENTHIQQLKLANFHPKFDYLNFFL